MIYVYAIGPGDAPAPRATGLEGRAVEAVADGPLAAFVSRDVSRAIEPREPELWRHQEVVAELMGETPLLPMRFGTIVAGEGELHAVLEKRRRELVRSLALVRGRVEIGVRAEWRDEVADSIAADGRAFMLAKLERHRAARRAAQELQAALGELAVESRYRVLPPGGAAFTAAYLVDREHGAEVTRRAEHLSERNDTVELAVTGPWPPYSFCGVRDD